MLFKQRLNEHVLEQGTLLNVIQVRVELVEVVADPFDLHDFDRDVQHLPCIFELFDRILFSAEEHIPSFEFEWNALVDFVFNFLLDCFFA